MNERDIDERVLEVGKGIHGLRNWILDNEKASTPKKVCWPAKMN